jgi:hypothetical protein
MPGLRRAFLVEKQGTSFLEHPPKAAGPTAGGAGGYSAAISSASTAEPSF